MSGPTLKDSLAPGRALRSQGGSVAGRRAGGQIAGVTLVELLVVLVLLGLMTAMSALSVIALRQPAGSQLADSLRAARATAIRTGSAVTIRFDSTMVRLLPDGRSIGGVLDPLTGDRRESPR